ncbi:hypothetical protein GEV33_013227 [Tenebrio molitor]|uniref:Uncharacterized protein n=1 Tax=Tenebrio molitor TaxID=7067 RepID=A0A8J6H7B5_TENMO|nr:hypothetical protein GEV33_013227 [Tenebrio molitor]
MFRKLVVVVLVAFLASDVSTAKITRSKGISPFTLYDQALEKLMELRQIVNSAILVAHSEISSSRSAHDNYADSVKDKGESELNDAAQTIDGQITDIKNLVGDIKIDVCLDYNVPALDNLLTNQISELKSCITDINNRLNSQISDVLLNVDSTINKVDDLETQLSFCTSGSIICISPIVRDIDVAKTELPENINVEVHKANENIDVLTTEVDGCSTSSVATYNTESGILLERIEKCVSTVEIAKIIRRRSISPFTLYDQALEKLAELRQIVTSAILVAHNEISSSRTAHDNYADSVKDKGASELNNAAQKIDGQITDIKNLVGDLDIDECLVYNIPALDELLTNQISELKSCMTDINNRLNSQISDVLLNVDSTIKKVDNLQNQLELCTSGSIICVSPVVRDIDVAKTELPETINIKVHNANENIDVLTTEVDGCSTSSVATYNTESGKLLEKIEKCVSTVEIAKIRRRKSISPFTLYDQALEKLAELRQIVNTAILLAHSDISSSTTAHNDYTDGVKDKGESELNDAAQTIDGHITDIKNLADDVNIDVCLQDDVPALDQLLASQISELKSCITDINNRVNNDMSEVLLNVDSTINKVDDLQNHSQRYRCG